MLNRNLAWICLLLIASAHAHHPWVLGEQAQVATGESLAFTVYFGHEFPIAEPLAADRIAAVSLLGPDGSSIEIGTADLSTGELKQRGFHVLGVEQARGYWTRTTEGGRTQSREGLTNAVHCSQSINGAKTFFQVGQGRDHTLSQTLGHPLELQIMNDPSSLETGREIRIKLVFNGQAQTGSVMLFNAESGEDPIETFTTDDEGLAQLPLSGPAPWLLMAVVEEDYPDRQICDVRRFRATLAFPANAE
jgi:uncharacterized GH25 family protein